MKAKTKQWPTLEQMREIVETANSIEVYREELATIAVQLATGGVNWAALPRLKTDLDEAFAQFRSAPILREPKDESDGEPPPPPPPPPPPEAIKNEDEQEKPSHPSARSGPRYTVEGIEGTLAELCVRYNAEYNRAYQRMHASKPWTIEEALGLKERPLARTSHSINTANSE